MRRPIALALAGLALGLASSAWAARLLEPLLFEVPARDPSSFSLVAGAVLLVAALASYLPARRAGRVDPCESLRAE